MPVPSPGKMRGADNEWPEGRKGANMSMKQINALRHRGEGVETEVYIKGRGYKGWVRRDVLIAWLARRGRLELV